MFQSKNYNVKEKGMVLTTEIQFLSFCFCKNKVKMSFRKEVFFFFSNKRSLGFVKQLLKTCHFMQTEVEIRRDVRKRWKR